MVVLTTPQFPGVTSGIDLGVDVLSKLAPHPNIVGVKLTCANAGKVSCLTAQFEPSQFAVFSGQSDWLLPCLIAGGVGCVTGIGNVFPRAVSKLYALWQAGKIEEARKLQGQVALAEQACKKGLAATKWGAAHFVGTPLGLSSKATFYPRKPYKPASPDVQQSTVSMMGVLEDLEISLASEGTSKLSNGTNGTKKDIKETTKVSHFTLNTGAKIPAVGFGTWKAAPGDAARATEAAFAAGYRHFDCAPLYGNEAEIGQVFKKAPVARSDFFVTTKLWSSDHKRAEQALDKSLRDLGLDYVDLWLMHWPVTLRDTGAEYGKEDRKAHDPEWDFRDTWREMEKLLGDGKGRVRAIGVANFSTVNLEKLLATAKVVPAVNQTEIQPLLPQDKLHKFCAAKGIHQTAFGPLGGSGSTLHEEPAIVEIAKRRGVPTGNVILSWGVAKGWSVIPKSTTPSRIEANLRDNFVPTESEIQQIDELAKTKGKRFNRPDWGTTIFHDDAEAGVSA